MDIIFESHASRPGTRQSWSPAFDLSNPLGFIHIGGYTIWVRRYASVSKKTKNSDETYWLGQKILAALPFCMGAVPGIESNFFTHHSLISRLPRYIHNNGYESKCEYEELKVYVSASVMSPDRMTDGACSARCFRPNCSDCNSSQRKRVSL